MARAALTSSQGPTAIPGRVDRLVRAACADDAEASGLIRKRTNEPTGTVHPHPCRRASSRVDPEPRWEERGTAERGSEWRLLRFVSFKSSLAAVATYVCHWPFFPFSDVYLSQDRRSWNITEVGAASALWAAGRNEVAEKPSWQIPTEGDS